VHSQHLVMSASAEETLALVDYYLQNEKERKEIALHGQKLVLAKHTYRQRAETFLTCLKKIRKK
jgi:spore maturation protein CgeB